MEPKLFVAMKAFIVHDGKVLILRESPKDTERTNVGKYDVVGGRVKLGQRFDESLLREIHEETGLAVKIGKPFHEVHGLDHRLFGPPALRHKAVGAI